MMIKMTKRKVNWENCKNNLQKLVAFWVKIEYRDLYENATTDEIKKLYGRWAKSASNLLKKCNNDLEMAKKILYEGRMFFRKKKLNYTIETILRNFEKIKQYCSKKRYDVALFNQYVDLCQENKTKIDKEKLEDFLNKIENPNAYLESKIIEEKRKMKIDYNIQKLIDEKFKNFLNFGGANE